MHSGIQRREVYLAPELAKFWPMKSELKSKSRIYEKAQPIRQLLSSAARWTSHLGEEMLKEGNQEKLVRLSDLIFQANDLPGVGAGWCGAQARVMPPDSFQTVKPSHLPQDFNTQQLNEDKSGNTTKCQKRI